jgi:glutamate-1-semialdehyde 2,1-aminomutase
MVRSTASLEAEFRRITPRSRAQWEKGMPVMPGGIMKEGYWSRPYPIYIDRADGCYLWDLDGRRYTDFANHHTAVILGHNHPSVMEAVEAEMRRGLALGAPTELEWEMADELTRRLPGAEKVRFVNSGTEASLHATRLARAATGRPKIAKFEGAYHGSHDALEVSVAPSVDTAGPDDSPQAVAEWKGMSDSSEEEVVILPYNQRESVELILREHRDELACVFYDGKPGLMDISPDFTRFVREITEELGILMVMDEVVSFRAGYGGYQGEVGVEPDVTILGKVIGGGFPVGAIAGKSEVMDVLDNTEVRRGPRQSGTFSANNFTLAAGLATLRELTPEAYDHLDVLRNRLHAGLESAFANEGLPCQVLSAGSVVSVAFSDEIVRDYRSLASSDDDLLDRLRLAVLIKGQYTQGGLGFSLSTPMQSDDIDALVGAVNEALAEDEEG